MSAERRLGLPSRPTHSYLPPVIHPTNQPAFPVYPPGPSGVAPAKQARTNPSASPAPKPRKSGWFHR